MRADRTCREYGNKQGQARKSPWQRHKSHFRDYHHSARGRVRRQCVCTNLQRRQFMSPRAHPEFGYFCLSQSFRRKARKALLSTVAVGVVAGGFVLWARGDPHESALTIVSVYEAPASADTKSTVVRSPPATTAG